MSASKNQSKFERGPIKKQHFEIWIDFLCADLTRKRETFKLGSSLVAPLLINFFLEFWRLSFFRLWAVSKAFTFCRRLVLLLSSISSIDYFDFISFLSFYFHCDTHCLYLVLNTQEASHFYWQWFHT